MTRHLTVSRISAYLTTAALDDVLNPATPPPRAIGTDGRSAEQFVVDVILRRGDLRRRVSAAGCDIYAVTASLVAEAAGRLIDDRAQARGAAAPGEAFDAASFLDALSPRDLAMSREK